MLIPFGILSAAAATKALRVSVAGYMVGGNGGGTNADKIAFPSDTKTVLASALTTARAEGVSGFANSGVAGYSAGGMGTSTNLLASIEKLAFPADTKSVLSGTLASAARSLLVGLNNSGVAGYVGGGETNIPSGTVTSTVNKITFPADSVSALGTGLSVATQFGMGFSNTGSAGYFVGGRNSAVANISTIDKFAFPSDTRSTLSPGLPSVASLAASFSNQGSAGYTLGDSPNSGHSRIFKMPFSTETTAAIGTVLGTGRIFGVGMANTDVAGYVGSGQSSTQRIEKLLFPGDTISTLGITTTMNSGLGAGFANEGVF